MKFKKKDILEIIDDDNNIIGVEDAPEIDPNKPSEAKKTSSNTARISGQNFSGDYLGRFGFYFYENNSIDKPDVIKELEESFGSDNTIKIMNIIKPHLEKFIEDIDTNVVNEAKVVEDKITKKDDDKSLKDNKNDNDNVVNSKDLKKVADLLKKLPKNHVNKLITLLEKL